LINKDFRTVSYRHGIGNKFPEHKNEKKKFNENRRKTLRGE